MSKYSASSKIVDVSKVFQYGKTQIPSDVRKSLQIKDGDKIVWRTENGKIFVEKV